jgi:CRISPR system Cascade subunit CasE
MAFPSDPKSDPHFLKPFKPEKIDAKHVHVKRSGNSGFLFRIDPQRGGRVVILVQSAKEPDWNYAFQNAGYLLAARPEVKLFDPQFATGQRLRFRLAANPTRRLCRHSRERDGKPVAEKWVGKRVPVPYDQLVDWLAEWRAHPDEPPGFRIDKDSTTIHGAYIYVNKAANGSGNRLRSVRYDGVLEVTDPERFRATLFHGIGPGKAFGFGLLSVAPCAAAM